MLVLASILLLVSGLGALLLLRYTLRFLKSPINLQPSLLDIFSLDRVIGLMMIIPPLVVLIIGIIFLFIIQRDFSSHFSHAFLLLGYWMLTSTQLLTLIILKGTRRRSPLVSKLALLLTAIPICYFSSFNGFEKLFGPWGDIGYLLPFLFGLGIVLFSYPALFQLYSVLMNNPHKE